MKRRSFLQATTAAIGLSATDIAFAGPRLDSQGMLTGLPTLDPYIKLYPGDVWVHRALGGQEHMAMAVNVAYHAMVEQHKKVLMVVGANRWLCSLRSGRMEETLVLLHVQKTGHRAFSSYCEAHADFSQRSGNRLRGVMVNRWTLDTFFEHAKASKADLVVIRRADHLVRHMRFDSNASYEERMTHLVTRVSDWARKQGIRVLMTVNPSWSQLNGLEFGWESNIPEPTFATSSRLFSGPVSRTLDITNPVNHRGPCAPPSCYSMAAPCWLNLQPSTVLQSSTISVAMLKQRRFS